MDFIVIIIFFIMPAGASSSWTIHRPCSIPEAGRDCSDIFSDVQPFLPDFWKFFYCHENVMFYNKLSLRFQRCSEPRSRTAAGLLLAEFVQLEPFVAYNSIELQSRSNVFLQFKSVAWSDPTTCAIRLWIRRNESESKSNTEYPEV